jgi:hypothetical protein
VALLSNFAWLLLVLLMAMQLPLLWIRQKAGLWELFRLDLALLAPATGAFLLYYAAVGRMRGRGWGSSVARAMNALLLGIALSVNNARAVLRGMAGQTGVFVRTPKVGGLATARVPSHRVAVAEAVMLAWLGATLALAAWMGVWSAMPFTLFFMAGLGRAMLGR